MVSKNRLLVKTLKFNLGAFFENSVRSLKHSRTTENLKGGNHVAEQQGWL